MIYLDYSATTMPNKEVIETYVNVSNKFIGNSNSLHKLGVNANELIKTCTKQIQNILNVDHEVIYTSGASESNNLAIKGICEKNRGKHIITTNLEHSSIYGPITYLVNKGYTVDFVNTNEHGLVDLNHLESLITDDTVLVTINYVNSELGLKQPINKINEIVKKHKNCYLHVDATQIIGKDKVNLKDIDLVSFTAHKFYGLVGIGVLLRKQNVKLENNIHGGKSTSIYRSGTPSTSLIASIAKALRLAYIDIDLKYKHVQKLNDILINNLSKYENVLINHNKYCLPHMLNISITNIKPETFLHALEEDEIYISTQSACSKTDKSRAVYEFTKNEKASTSSLRISISYLTTEEEINKFIKSFKKNIERLTYENN